MGDVIERARVYLSAQREPCGNDACIGAEAREMIMELRAEVERLREAVKRRDNELCDTTSRIEKLEHMLAEAHDNAFNASIERDETISEIGRLRALLDKRDGEPYEEMRNRLALELKENEEMRADAELGRMVRESLPEMARLSGKSSVTVFDPFDQTWRVACVGYGSFTSRDLDNAITTMLGDAQRDLGESKTPKGVAQP